MEEKILIEGKNYGLNKKSVKIICLIAAILSTIVAALVFSITYSEYKEKYTFYYEKGEKVEYKADSTVFPQCEHSYERKYVSSYSKKWVPKENYTYADFVAEHPTALSYANCENGSLFGMVFLIYLCGAGITLGLLLILGIITFFLRASKIKISNMFVYGSVYKKCVVLPVDSITAYATGGFKTIAVKTPGGSIHVALIRNQKEVVEVLKQLLMERQAAKQAPVKEVKVEEEKVAPVIEVKETKEEK